MKWIYFLREGEQCCLGGGRLEEGTGSDRLSSTDHRSPLVPSRCGHSSKVTRREIGRGRGDDDRV